MAALVLIALAIPSSGSSAQTPELRAIHSYDTAGSIGRIIAQAPQSFRDFRGLLVNANKVTELYPILPYIFFDQGGAAIPVRYHTFTDPSSTGSFADSAIAGDMLEKYHHLLDVIGYRMRKHPNTRIELQGYGPASEPADAGAALSSRRGETVAEYLRKIWGIDPDRIRLLPGEEYPRERANIKDPRGAEENRRVELRSGDWEIVRPIVMREVRYRTYPEETRFRMSNGGIEPALIARRVIEIRRDGELWHTLGDMGRNDTITRPCRWNNDEFSLPPEGLPLAAQLVLYTADSAEHRSAEIPIPVEILKIEKKRFEEMADIDTEIYTFIGFAFDSPTLGALNERILREYLYSIRQGAHIQVTGRSDVTGFDRGTRLSQSRADAITTAIRRNVPQGSIDSIRSRGLGEGDPLYSSELPEGRFYARSVRVVVETPFQWHRWP